MTRPTIEELKAYAKKSRWAEDFEAFPPAMIEYWIASAWGEPVDSDLTARYEAAKEEHRRMVAVRLGVA